MKKWILAMILSACVTQAGAAEISGVNLPDSVKLGSASLVLNGAGLRTKAGLFDVYVIGLYVPTKTHDAQTVINAHEYRRVTLVMKRALDANTLDGAFHEGLEANTAAAELQSLKPGIDALDKIFGEVGKVKEGDTVQLDFTADGSTLISLNGQSKGRVPGSDFSAALLRIWLGPKPVQDSVKRDLLKG